MSTPGRPLPEGASARVDGAAASLDQALAAAAELLLRARRPLVTGMAEATVEAQRAAVELAELLQGVIDPAGSAAHAGAAAAFRTMGEVTATLGEARARAELLVYWGVDPDAVYPDFHAHFLAPVAGGPVRRTLAVDVGAARGPAGADQRLAVDPDREVELLWALRAAVRGRRLAPPPDALPPGWSPARLRELAGRLAACRYGVFFFEAEPPADRREPLRPLALGALAMDDRAGARLRVLGVRPPGNAAGAEAVLTWQTGFPAAVDFARGYPRFAPGEHDAATLLACAGTDAVLLVGGAGELPPAARAALTRLPLVAIGGPAAAGARVAIPTRVPEQTPGSCYRMDGLPLRRRIPETEMSAPTDEDVLRRLSALVREAGRP